MSVAGLVDAEVATAHALGGRCRSCGDGGGCERSARAQEALAEWAAAGRVRAGLARYLLDLADAGWEGAPGPGVDAGGRPC
jgi:hypothetical protein